MDLSLYPGAARAVLSGVQDGVSVTLGECWPLVMVNGQHQMAMPGAKIVDGTLELWYGNEDAPTMRLQSIKLTN